MEEIVERLKDWESAKVETKQKLEETTKKLKVIDEKNLELYNVIFEIDHQGEELWGIIFIKRKTIEK